MLGVVFDLQLAPALGFVDRDAHGVGDPIRVHVDPTVGVARGSPDRLNQRARAAQETFLVRVQDRDQADFRQVEPLAQQVDADQHVELTGSQIAQNLHALEGVDVGVQVAHPDPELRVVLGQLLGHALGQGSDQHALAGLPRAP